MRLLNTTTLQLESFDATEDRPPYAILSHRWESEEVLFEDVRGLAPLALETQVLKAGTTKVVGACRQSLQDGYKYVWIDTCCIDKSSSAELSEAINSMFKWYEAAGVCYAYLVDVEEEDWQVQFEKSHWFKRGWTLQELVAPQIVSFVDKNWNSFGSRTDLANRISTITGINIDVFRRKPFLTITSQLQKISVATRMSWMIDRYTTREEDLAYCLLGIFDINMPLLYGEGGDKAFLRLQREIVRGSNDQSILVWSVPKADNDMCIPPPRRPITALATSPHFNFPAEMSTLPQSNRIQGISLSGQGLQVDVLLARIRAEEWVLRRMYLDNKMDPYVAILGCNTNDNFQKRAAIIVEPLEGDSTYRKYRNHVLWISKDPSRGILATVPNTYGEGSKEHIVSLGNMRYTTITLVDQDPLAEANTFTPPLHVSLALQGGAPSYQLFASAPPVRANYIAPSPLPFPHIFRSTGQMLCGVLYFRPIEAELGSGFFIIWGIRLPLAAAATRWYPSRGKSWWGGMDLWCAVAPQAHLVGDVTLAQVNSWCEEKVFDLEVSKMWEDEVDLGHPKRIRTGFRKLRRSMAREHKVQLDGLTIEVSGNSVDFLDRRSFELIVHIS
jgi:hypothetical protein